MKLICRSIVPSLFVNTCTVRLLSSVLFVSAFVANAEADNSHGPRAGKIINSSTPNANGIIAEVLWRHAEAAKVNNIEVYFLTSDWIDVINDDPKHAVTVKAILLNASNPKGIAVSCSDKAAPPFICDLSNKALAVKPGDTIKITRNDPSNKPVESSLEFTYVFAPNPGSLPNPA